ncbi:MAG: hypothetical protein K8R37_14545, partial [Bacteroidales bacterium]|nr:hypothetical protein [Bacteroidales bacterium]
MFEIIYYNCKKPSKVGHVSECFATRPFQGFLPRTVLENMAVNEDICCTPTKATSRKGGLVQH